MFEIVDNKIVFTTSLSQVITSEEIIFKIKEVESLIENFNTQIEVLKKDLELVLRLEDELIN